MRSRRFRKLTRGLLLVIERPVQRPDAGGGGYFPCGETEILTEASNIAVREAS